MLTFTGFHRCLNQAACDFPKSGRIRKTIDHELRQYLAGIQRDVEALSDHPRNIQAMERESLEQLLPVRLGAANDDGTPGFETCADQTSKPLQLSSIVPLQLSHMLRPPYLTPTL